MRPTVWMTAAAAGLATGAALTIAGPLNPPAGPVTSTYKTLGEIEPRTAISQANTPGDAASLFRITQPGSYYLTGNISGVAGKAAIVVNSHNVTIDLGGFAIIGGANGIVAVPPPPAGVVTNVAIRNGLIDSCSVAGVTLYSSFDATVERVQAKNCGGAGVETGSNCIVRDCLAHYCNPGFAANSDAHYINCSVTGSVGHGFSFGGSCLFDRCVAYFCDGRGFSGFEENTFHDCLTSRSTLEGMYVGADCLIDRCQVTQSGGNSVVVGNGTTVRECTVATGNADGVVAAGGCSIIGNTIHDNARNGGTGTGLRVTGNDGVVDGNRVSGNGNWGIYVSGTNNLVVRNWSRGHSNLNFYAPSNDSAQMLSAPGASFVATNPFANITR